MTRTEQRTAKPSPAQIQILREMQSWGCFAPQTDTAERTAEITERLGLSEKRGYTYHLTPAGEAFLTVYATHQIAADTRLTRPVARAETPARG